MEKLSTKCKNCGGQLKFDPKKQTLRCEYCETSYHLPKANVNAVLVRGYSNAFHPNELNKNLNFYKCSMCGNAYFSACEEKSQECLECGNVSLEKIKSAGFCADGIIPFEIDKEDAAKKMVNYLKSIPNVPKSVFDNALPENLTGVFVPVWNFIFDTDASWTANASKLKKNWNGTYYSVPVPLFGTKSESIKSADQCATTNETDDLLELFNETDYDKIIPYTSEWTFGYKIDDTNRNIHDYYEYVINTEEKKIAKEISNKILRENQDVTDLQINTVSHDIYFNYVYVPVYVYKYNYKGKVYKNYISGSTGKVAGKTPTSLKGLLKILVKYLGIAALIILLYLLIK